MQLISKILQAGEYFGPHLALADGFQSGKTFDIRCDEEEARCRRRIAWEAAEKVRSPDRIKFIGKNISSASDMEKLGYKTAVIDGIEYTAGDYVVMRPEDGK